MWLNLRDTGALPDDNRLWACAAAVSQENMNKWKEYTGKDGLPSGVERYMVEHEGKEYDLTGLVYVPVNRSTSEDADDIRIERIKDMPVATAVDAQQLCVLLGLEIDRDPQSDRIVTPDFVLSARITDGWIPLEVLMVPGQTPALGETFSSLTAKAGNAQLLNSGAGRWEYNGALGGLTWTSLGMMNREARVSDKQEQFLADAGNAWYRDNIMVPELRQEVLVGFNTEGQPVNREAALQELRDALAVPNPDGTSSAWVTHPQWLFQFSPVVSGSYLPSGKEVGDTTRPVAVSSAPAEGGFWDVNEDNGSTGKYRPRWDLLGGVVQGALADNPQPVPFQAGGKLASGQTIKAATQNREEGTWSVETTDGNKYRLSPDYYYQAAPADFTDELGLKIVGQTSQGRIYADKDGKQYFKEGDGSRYAIGPQGWTAENAAARERDRQQSGEKKLQAPAGAVLLSDHQQTMADYNKDNARLQDYLNTYGYFDQSTQRWVINKPGFNQQSVDAFAGSQGALGKGKKLLQDQAEQGIYDPANKTLTKHISNTRDVAVYDEKSGAMKPVRVVDERDDVYRYDDQGAARLSKRTIYDGSTERTYGYDDKGNRKLEAETLFEDERITGYTFDPDGKRRLAFMSTGKQTNGAFVADFRAVYSYDDKGQQQCTRYWYADGKISRIKYANGDREEIVRYSGENDYVSEKYVFNQDKGAYQKQVITVKPGTPRDPSAGRTEKVVYEDGGYEEFFFNGDKSWSVNKFSYDQKNGTFVPQGTYAYRPDGSEVLLGTNSQGKPAIRGLIELPEGAGIICEEKAGGSVEVKQGDSTIIIKKDKDGKLVFDASQKVSFTDFTGSGQDYQETIAPAVLTIRGDNVSLTSVKEQPVSIFDPIVKPIEQALRTNLVNIDADPYTGRRNVVLSAQGIGETVSFEKTGLSSKDAAVKMGLGMYDIPVVSSWVPSFVPLMESNPLIPFSPGKMFVLAGDATAEQKIAYFLLPNNVSYQKRLDAWKEHAYSRNSLQGLPADEAALNKMRDGLDPAAIAAAGKTVYLPRQYTVGDAASDAITYGSLVLGGEGLAARAVTAPVTAWKAVHPLARSYVVGATTYLAADEASSLIASGKLLSADEAGAALRTGGVTGAVTYGALKGAGTGLSYTTAGKNVLAGGVFSNNAWVNKAGTSLVQGAQAGGEPFAASWQNVWKFGKYGPVFSLGNTGIDLIGQLAGNALSGKNKPLRLSWTGKDQGMGFFQGMALDTAGFFKTGVYLPQTLGVFTMPLEATAEGSFARAVGSEHSVSNLGRSLVAKLTNPKELAAIAERNSAKAGGQSSLLGRWVKALDNAVFVTSTISSTENISEFALEKAGFNQADAQAIAGQVGFASLLFVPSGHMGRSKPSQPAASAKAGPASLSRSSHPTSPDPEIPAAGRTTGGLSGALSGKNISKAVSWVADMLPGYSSSRASRLANGLLEDRPHADSEIVSGLRELRGEPQGYQVLEKYARNQGLLDAIIQDPAIDFRYRADALLRKGADLKDLEALVPAASDCIKQLLISGKADVKFLAKDSPARDRAYKAYCVAVLAVIAADGKYNPQDALKILDLIRDSAEILPPERAGDLGTANADFQYAQNCLLKQDKADPRLFVLTIAHEMGHNFLYHKGFHYSSDMGLRSIHEFVADLFAINFCPKFGIDIEFFTQWYHYQTRLNQVAKQEYAVTQEHDAGLSMLQMIRNTAPSITERPIDYERLLNSSMSVIEEHIRSGTPINFSEFSLKVVSHYYSQTCDFSQITPGSVDRVLDADTVQLWSWLGGVMGGFEEVRPSTARASADQLSHEQIDVLNNLYPDALSFGWQLRRGDKPVRPIPDGGLRAAGDFLSAYNFKIGRPFIKVSDAERARAIEEYAAMTDEEFSLPAKLGKPGEGITEEGALFHGTNRVFTEFLLNGQGELRDSINTLGDGVYFVSNPKQAGEYAKVRATQLKGTIPRVVTARLLPGTRLLDTRNGLPAEIVNDFTAYLQFQKDVYKRRGLSPFLDAIVKRQKEGLSVDLRAGMPGQGLCSGVPIANILSARGFDGVIGFEGGESAGDGKTGRHNTFVVFDPQRIITKEAIADF